MYDFFFKDFPFQSWKKYKHKRKKIQRSILKLMTVESMDIRNISECNFGISDILTFDYTVLYIDMSWLVSLIIILQVEWVDLCVCMCVWNCSGYFGTAVKSGRSWGVCWHCRPTTMILTVRERNRVCVWEEWCVWILSVEWHFKKPVTSAAFLHCTTASLHTDERCWETQEAKFPCQTPTVTKANIFHHYRPAFSHWPCTSFTHTHILVWRGGLAWWVRCGARGRRGHQNNSLHPALQRRGRVPACPRRS